MRTHFALMLLYSGATALFFALLWRSERRDRIRLFTLIFCSLLFGAMALGWAMYPHPIR